MISQQNISCFYKDNYLDDNNSHKSIDDTTNSTTIVKSNFITYQNMGLNTNTTHINNNNNPLFKTFKNQ